MLPVLLVACAPKVPPPAADPPPPPDPAAAMVDKIAALEFADLGSPVLQWDSIPSPRATKEDPHELIVVLVEFPDVRFDRFAGDPEQGAKLAKYYDEQLFDDTYTRVDTLSHYYAAQSDGAYHVDGLVLPPVTLSQPLRHYGSPSRPEGGDWRNDDETEDLVEEALLLARDAHPEVEWAKLDRWDPRDFDGDGQTAEPDGYLDHLVIVYAGKGQHACQRLYRLDERLNPNVGPEELDALAPEARACADRLWPHRSEMVRREYQGPTVGGTRNGAGGVPLTPDLWAADYNMQCEYTGVDTFIHEFGHSIGLPDVYARTSTNSTGVWEVMSRTASPSPQNLSTWSRLMLGWTKPLVVRPPGFGGPETASFHLGERGAPASIEAGGLVRGAIVVLPPQVKEIALTPLPPASGSMALYSGQGNDMKRTATLSLDLRSWPADEPVTLEFDAWWDIEAAWDFAYVEHSTDGGLSWTRFLPAERKFMPAEHGHDGPKTTPGFTGVSGDFDGDGKNENMAGCDPAAPVASGEDKVGAAHNPCEDPSWVRVAFDLTPWRGTEVKVRLRYFTDGAAVEPGILIDNVRVGAVVSEDFEREPGPLWALDGFTRSPGHHTALVPHYYLLEARDPYDADPDGWHDYDRTLADGDTLFYWNGKGMSAFDERPRPGVVAWYFNGALPWSENDPALNGPGRGYLLVVDSNPNEVRVPALGDLLLGDPASYDTRYALEGAQDRLGEAFFRTMCFVREREFYPSDIDLSPAKKWCPRARGPAPVKRLVLGGKKLRHFYEIEEMLPGPEQEEWDGADELFDYRARDGQVTWRLRDRRLRSVHSMDAPFSPEPFADGIVFYDVDGDALRRTGSDAHPAVASFSDANPARWLNPHLPFGGVALPTEGFSFDVLPPDAGSPPGAKAKVVVRWAQGSGLAY